MIRNSLLAGSATLAVSQAIVGICSLARNVIIARMLGPEDFGIASAIALSISIVEMSTAMSVDRYLVQSKNGKSPLVQATLQSVELARGATASVVLFFAAPLIAHMFKIPESIGAFQLTALIPVIRGLASLDASRRQREMQFGPSGVLEAAPQIAALVMAAPLAMLFRDYHTMVAIVLLQISVYCFTSHLIAVRSYALAFDRLTVGEVLRFGMPLMLNGLLMFGTLQGDRAVIGAMYDMHQLGVYSAAFALIMMPTQMFIKILSMLLLPILARQQDDPEGLRQAYEQADVACCVTALVLFTGTLLAGPAVIALLFGEQYTSAMPLVPWIASMFTLRILRVAPTLAAIATGRTMLTLMSNVFRMIGVALAVAAALADLPLVAIAASGVLGEALAYGCAWALRVRRVSIRSSIAKLNLVVTTAACVGLFLVARAMPLGSSPMLEIGISIIALLMLGLLIAAASRLRPYLRLASFAKRAA